MTPERQTSPARKPVQRLRCGAAIAVALVLVSCGGCGGRGAPPAGTEDPGVGDTVTVAPEPAPPPPPSYVAVEIDGAKRLARLRRALGHERFETVLRVNRVDLGHVRAGVTLMVPDSLTMALDSTTRMLALSPFPLRLGAVAPQGKLLLVSLRVQAFAAYGDGVLTRWGPTSTGRESLQTPAGLYHTNWKDQERTSTFNEEWLLKWYVNLESFLGISLHQFELPGYPASHACVRLREDDAMWLYAWVEQWRLGEDPRVVLQQGTPVVVFGEYAYRQRPPWKRLEADSTATRVTQAEVEEALQSYLPAGIAGRDSTGVARPRATP